jgi:hypothetical protein
MLVADIGRIGATAELGSNGLGLGEIAIDDNDQIAVSGEFTRAGRTNTAGAAGHDTDAPG